MTNLTYFEPAAVATSSASVETNVNASGINGSQSNASSLQGKSSSPITQPLSSSNRPGVTGFSSSGLPSTIASPFSNRLNDAEPCISVE
ncbi:unnamed protein product, partial [Protopolystoma xenopodis]